MNNSSLEKVKAIVYVSTLKTVYNIEFYKSTLQCLKLLYVSQLVMVAGMVVEVGENSQANRVFNL